uniref:exodeoxyribonuclease III n=1 Tax=Maylandia zebra TaxID=106582 RepID=A0A3P9DD43_9CICH
MALIQTDFKIASWNVKGLNNGIKRKKILTYLKLSRVYIAFIQEMHLCKSEALKLKCSWVGKVFYSPGTGKSRGVSVLIHKAVSFAETKVITDKGGRFILVYGQLLDTPIILCNIYAPNADILAFFHNLSQYLLELEGAQIVVGGDFNQILDQDLDRSLPRRGTESKSVVAIRQMTSDLGLNDIWWTMHPEGREYSFYSPPHNVYTRIDYFISELYVSPVMSLFSCVSAASPCVPTSLIRAGPSAATGWGEGRQDERHAVEESQRLITSVIHQIGLLTHSE